LFYLKNGLLKKTFSSQNLPENWLGIGLSLGVFLHVRIKAGSGRKPDEKILRMSQMIK